MKNHIPIHFLLMCGTFLFLAASTFGSSVWAQSGGGRPSYSEDSGVVEEPSDTGEIIEGDTIEDGELMEGDEEPEAE